ncbi:lipopolysaccharide biosynthesis protein [Janthinobacterium tructae]|uniref:lipopolysaccharide biosynthesis protein n=1 Tax=Janthinobacterium tructae TaxID=2590869 RepID=UPI00249C6DB2|nr:lipopolysaccharide biosynthesis protein [Janthinobacterium tructae]MDI3292646.1 lipopolysaccharide biosynthesis protein [Janthinobacterium tructae]
MPASADIKTRAVSAVKWAALGTVTRFVLQMGVQIVLARLLGPEIYGLFAMGLLVMTLSTFLADFGFGWGLVQNQELHDDDIRFAFTWQFLSGGAAMLGLYLLAPWIAAYFNEPRLESIVCWLSLTCLLSAMTAPSSNLLRRQLNFRWLNIAQILSYALGYLCVGVPLALMGAGVWTLVSAWLVQALSLLILTYCRNPHTLRPLLWYAGARRSTNTGSTVFITNLSNWFLNNLDRVFLGRMLSAHAVGVYAVGYNLANTPNSLFLSALQPAFLAAGARLQDDLPGLRQAYLSVIAATWIVIGPVFVVLACLAGDLIATLYGDAWHESSRVLGILALGMPAYVTWGMSTPILWNTGGKHLESLLQMPLIVLACLALWQFAGLGVQVVAVIAAGTLLARALVIGTAACRRLQLGPADLWPSAWRSVVLMLLAAAGAHGGSLLGHAAGHGPLPALLLGSFCGGGLCVLAGLSHPQLLGRRIVDLLGRFSPPVPARVGVYLRSKCLV